MLRRLTQRISDMRTIKVLCTDAEKHANAAGQTEPGLEHFVLAALALPDGSARRAFERIGADPAQFTAAIARQYADALNSIGIAASPLDTQGDTAAIAPGKGPYQAKPAVQSLMQQLASRPGSHAAEPLLGAHVIAVAAAARFGVAPRALKAMGIDLQALINATQDELRTATAR
ncbi:hypothetical protein IGB42_01788 [Andreprevotia sp. IGB-42]|uniref:Clp protease N-terminal domain-containing protein n=1 Tax=Andreprevotia sp. IGB-42 TaxID=2497473 RepID=UPI0013575D75|nr:Clp protease N-terminal domain-containing protein [Andreprevotia sp. IGB-42]KAF0813437.1 hypothetical protein IGB42_01788 [Andreprevotia sp. IGB-42]